VRLASDDMREQRIAAVDCAIERKATVKASLWDQNYFRSTPAIAPKHNRSGMLLYWAGAQGRIVLPLKVVLILTNPEAMKTETVSFEFR
jgi:hypothetical protein